MKNRTFWLLILVMLFYHGCSEFEFSEKGNVPKLEVDLSGRALLPKEVRDSTINAEKLVASSSKSEQQVQNSQLNTMQSLVNYALQATVTAESTYPGYSVQRIKDGSRNTTVGPSYSWANNHPAGGKLPESVFLKWSSLKTVEKIDIYTSSGYALRNYTIQYRTTTTGSWINLVVITGNTSVYRSHTFSPVTLREIQIICQLGPANQSIYGRLNEVEVYGAPEPTLPPISVENGMLVFNSQADVIQTLAYLEYNYDQYDDAFLAQYSHLSDDEIAAVEEATGFNDAWPYIQFETQFGISSKRAQLAAAENLWLETTSADYPYQNENPDYSFIEDDEIRTIINNYGEVKVGSTYYVVNPDGTYYEIPAPYYNEVIALRNHKVGDPLPVHTILNQSTPYAIFPFPNPCRSSERDRDRKTNGNWRIDHITSIWNHPWRSRIMAKTKSYKKVNGRWKKWRTTIGAQVWGTVKDNSCEVSQYMESFYKQRRKKKVKSYVQSGILIRAESGSIQSYHYGSNVGTFIITLTW